MWLLTKKCRGTYSIGRASLVQTPVSLSTSIGNCGAILAMETQLQKFWLAAPAPVAGVGRRLLAAYSPQTSLSTLTQFSPMILRTTRSEWPRLSRVSVRLGNSPTVRMPSGLMILPKLVRRRA
ncbi:hypothetical protein D3C78_1549770 [compost metagenome]